MSGAREGGPDLQECVSEALRDAVEHRPQWAARVAEILDDVEPCARLDAALACAGSTADDFARLVLRDAWTLAEMRSRKRSAVAWRAVVEAHRVAGRLLAILGPRARGLEPLLVDAVQHAPAITRECSASVLASMAPGRAAADALVACVRDHGIETGSELARALAAAATADPARMLLGELIGSADASLRKAALLAAQHAPARAEALVPDMLRLLGQRRLAGAAALALAAVAPGNPEVREALLLAREEGGAGGRFSAAAIDSALAALGVEAAERSRASDAARRDGRDFADVVNDLFLGHDDIADVAARIVLDRAARGAPIGFGEAPPQAALRRLIELDPLAARAEAVQDPESWRSSRLSHARALALDALTDAVVAGAAGLPADEAIVAQVSSDRQRVVRAAAAILSTHPPAATRAVESLLDAHRDGPAEARHAVQSALVAAMRSGGRDLGALRSRLASTESRTAADACAVLAAAGPAAASALDDVLEILRRRDDHLLGPAAEAAASIAPDDDAVSEAVASAAGHASARGDGTRIARAVRRLADRGAGPHPAIARVIARASRAGRW